MKKRRWYWVTVDLPSGFAMLWKGHAKPKMTWYGYHIPYQSPYQTYFLEDFNTMTGLRLKGGDCVKVFFSAEIVP